MEIKKAMRKYKLPNPSTPEDLEMRCFSRMDGKVLNFGDKVLLAGYYYPGYFGAVYEFLSDDHTCEGAVELVEVSDVAFFDDGHAIQWCLSKV